MFKGSHPVTIDAKGRIAIPASDRQSLLEDCGGRLVVTQYWEGCLLLYPMPKFQAFESQLLAKASFDPKMRDIQRFLIGNAREIDMDRQGRALLPAPLRAFAQLEGKAVLSGLGHLFEIWDEATYHQRNANIASTLAEDAANGELPGVLMEVNL